MTYDEEGDGRINNDKKYEKWNDEWRDIAGN